MSDPSISQAISQANLQDNSRGNIRALDVAGTKVYGGAGEHLGQIDDLVIGKVDGRVKYAILSFGGFLGIGEEHHPVPWETLTYDTARNGYVVDLTRERLEGAPRYAASSEPDWDDPTYNDRIASYYGPAPYL